MKKIQLSRAMFLLGTTGLFAGAAVASDRGFYMGASAGYSVLSTPNGSAYTVPASTKETLYIENSSKSDLGGFGGNLFAGYNINKNLAVELDYTKYAKSEYSSTQSQYSIISDDKKIIDGDNYTFNGQNTSSLTYDTSSIDLFVKGSISLIDQVSAFVKLGASYVMQGVDYSNPKGIPDISLDSSQFATPSTGSSTEKAIRPAAALGLSCQATEHISTSIFAQGFYGSGDFNTDSTAIASAYLIGASIGYDFL